MKQQLLTFLCAILFTSAFAQKPDSALAIAHYKYSWIRDTTQKDKPYTENMVLVVGRNASVYKSYDRKMQMAAMKKDMMAQMQSGTNQFKMTSRGASSALEFFQFPNENKLIRKDRIITTYLIEEPIPHINWKISTDTLTIGSLACQKATTHFKGRDYTAWFCPDLPYRAGPWKLNGLPGLIVEAYDTKKEVDFKFDGIENVVKADKTASGDITIPGGGKITMFGMEDNEDPNLIALPDNGVKTTEKEFADLKEAMRKDPNAFMQSAMAGSGGSVRVSGAQVSNTMTIKRESGPATVMNNPVELPEKK